jgi:hypothetical protein
VQIQLRNVLFLLSLALLFFSFTFRTSAVNDPRFPKQKMARHYRVLKDSAATKKDTADTILVIKHRKYQFAANYASNSTFVGRRDSVSHFVISPSFSYTGIKGWNASLGLVHIDFPPGPKKTKPGIPVKQAKTPILDELDGALGWDHDWGEHFTLSLNNTHSYFDAKSSRIRSVIDNDFNIGLNSDWKYITADASGDWAHGVKTAYGRAKDYFFTFSLSHNFDFDPFWNTKGEIEIEPKFSLVAGTQSFFAIYTKGHPLDSAVAKKIVIDAAYEKQLAKFGLLNYVFAVPVTFTRHKWAFAFEWDYNIPQNVPRGSVSSPYPVYILDLKFTMKGKPVVLMKKKRNS